MERVGGVLSEERRQSPGLVRGYVRAGIAALVALVLAWLFGIRAIPGHVTPFYAVWAPVVPSLLVPSAVTALLVALWLAYGRAVEGRPGSRARTPAIVGVASLLVGAIVLRNELASGGLTSELVLRRAARLFAWQLPTVVALCVAVPVARALSRALASDPAEEVPPSLPLIASLVALAFLLPAAIAAARGGLAAIPEPFLRTRLEYVGDLDQVGWLRSFFAHFLEIRPRLSLHGRVHPPGAVALLWIVGAIVGRSPWPMALGTMAVGALGVVPLHLWCREVAGQRAAWIASALYVTSPSIVLFTATCVDIMFVPFTLLVLFLAFRALRTGSTATAVAAGVAYGVITLLSFALMSVAAYVVVEMAWRWRQPSQRTAVWRTALGMAVGVAVLLGVVALWSGFDVVRCFQACHAQFQVDERVLDAGGRYPAWAWKLLNPLAVACFAGIPVSVLAVRALRLRMSAGGTPVWLYAAAFALMMLVYPGRGETERTGLYLLPCLLIPAACAVDGRLRAARSAAPLVVTCFVMIVQCWLTELTLYTYW